MITEDYVSFETAKLLKEKGFNEATNRYYNAQYDQIRTVSDTFLFHWNDEEFTKRALLEGAIAIPTLQMAMKWLREVHKLHCDIAYDDLDWFWNIISVSNCTPVEDRPKLLKEGFAGIATYEEACEVAIKYCLENLI